MTFPLSTAALRRNTRPNPPLRGTRFGRVRFGGALGGLVLTALLLSGGGAGCTQTAYDLFPDGELDGDCAPASGGAVGESCGSGAGGSAAVASGGASPGGGAAGSGGAATASCDSVLDPSLVTSSLVFVQSGLCLTVGAPTTIGEEPGFLTTTMPCDSSLGQRWTVRQADEGSVEIRSELVDMNVDVRLASNEDGTSVLLYTPHALYNQRFFPSDLTGNDIRLAARHSPSDCLSERPDPDGVAPQRNVEIWPCADTDASQLMDIVTCVEMP